MHVALPRSRTGEKASPSEPRLGFVAAGRDEPLGYVGGFLLTTARGRPLEFHYTSPVKPSPTHRILYGDELEPYIFSELIAANLLRQTNIEPLFVITDQPLVLNHRPIASCPILCVTKPPEGQTTAELTPHAKHPADLENWNRWMAENHPELKLHEPLGRIWEALREVLTRDTKQAA